MEPFSITCHSCAARLKVARPELIDQTLACPKCGSMIHVQHPTGWKPPIPESKGSMSALSSVVSGNDFDQIDDLLPKPGDPARKLKRQIQLIQNRKANQNQQRVGFNNRFLPQTLPLSQNQIRLPNLPTKTSRFYPASNGPIRLRRNAKS